MVYGNCDGLQVVSEKIIQFSFFFYYEKSKQSTANSTPVAKNIHFPVCKKIFKWYQTINPCSGDGLLSDEW